MDALFNLPRSARQPLAKVVIVAGPSGTGKTRFTRRSGLPFVSLDDFYKDGDEPGLPRRHGMVDWDSVTTWNKSAAVDALVELCTKGETRVPLYDIPTSKKRGERKLSLDGAKFVLAEGIFAGDIVSAVRAEGILADAICLQRPRLQAFWFRLMRDLDEARKPPINLIRRGIAHFFEEPAMYAKLESQGCRLVSWEEAHETLTHLLATAR
ncbi:MAG: ATP-binding protein [Actinomycetaceae bacterium]|nr:ATP-binding protein [Actinomycetaceae bacterium]MDY6083494.1 ATP-binding protein [Actinomycetaceae bacterium]